MKCPKCGYLGFEPVDRCRHCGYDFSLAPPGSVNVDGRAASTSAVPDLPIRPQELHLAPSDDSSDDLPLFGPSKPLTPRPPLAVRRSTPPKTDTVRIPGNQPRTQSLELTLEPELPSPRWASLGGAPEQAIPLSSDSSEARESKLTEEIDSGDSAGIASRLFAATVDLLILALVDAAVIYFTLQICGIGPDDFAIIPKGPLLAFLLLQNGGYLVAFTAGGQTLGKVAARIRVVAADADESLDFRRALLRTAVWFALAVPAGLGFLTLLGRQRRGLHDRFAGTRVVRASA